MSGMIHLPMPAVWGTLAVLALLTTSCGTTRTLMVSGPRPARSDTLGVRPQPISAYVTHDGRKHELDGVVQMFGDSLRFERPHVVKGTIVQSGSPEVFFMPRDSVMSVDGDFWDSGRLLLNSGIVFGILYLSWQALFFYALSRKH